MARRALHLALMTSLVACAKDAGDSADVVFAENPNKTDDTAASDDGDTAGGEDSDASDDTGAAGADDTGSSGADDTGSSGPDDTGSSGADDTGTTADDTGSASYSGPVEISGVSWSCSGDDVALALDVTGASASADLWFAQTTSYAWTELHTLTPSDLDWLGYWTEYYLTLTSVYPDFGAVVEGTTTGFDCGKHGSTFIFQLDVYDSANAYVDCALFGVDVGGTVGGDGSGGYYGYGWDGTCSNIW